MRRLFFLCITGTLLAILASIFTAVAIGPAVPDTEIIFFTTRPQNFAFHLMDPYRNLSFEVARDLDFNFLYGPSHDGERIFVRKSEMVDGFMTEREGVIDLQTGEFTHADTLDFFTYATWTADDRILVSGGNRIQYLDVQQHTLELLHETQVNDAPVAAANGCCVAYTNFSGIYIYEIATGNVITIDTSLAGDTNFSAPRFSPDSTKLAYLSLTYEDNNNGLFIFDFATGEKRKVTDNTLLNIESPAWSPDGQKIAFVRGAGQRDIYIMDVGTGRIQQVSHTPEYEQTLMWVK